MDRAKGKVALVTGPRRWDFPHIRGLTGWTV